MKKSLLRKLFVASTLAVAAPAATLTAQTIVGSGPDTALFVIEAASFGGPLSYEYRFDLTATPNIDSYQAFFDIDAADANLSIVYTNFPQGNGDPNFFVNSITYQGVTLTNTTGDEFQPFWFQSVSGGRSGFPTADTISAGDWQDGSGISSPFRFLADGSSDGLVYGDFGDAPSIAPIPEPSTITLLVLAGIAGAATALRRRRISRAA